MAFLGTRRCANDTWIARSGIFLVAITLFCSALGATPIVAATVTGVAVSGFGSNTAEGLTPVNVGSLGGPAIPYYIPLSPTTSGVYGAGGSCSGNGIGTCSDTITVGSSTPPSGSLDMYLKFVVATGGPSTLTVLFSDLDLKPGNDPNGFTETLKAVFKADGTTELLNTGVLTTVGGIVSDLGNDVLKLEANLGNLTAGSHYLLLSFTSTIDKSKLSGTLTNTVEYLVAQVTTTPPNPGSGPVPLPGALVLFGTVVAGSLGFGAFRRRRSA